MFLPSLTSSMISTSVKFLYLGAGSLAVPCFSLFFPLFFFVLFIVRTEIIAVADHILRLLGRYASGHTVVEISSRLAFHRQHRLHSFRCGIIFQSVVNMQCMCHSDCILIGSDRSEEHT